MNKIFLFVFTIVMSFFAMGQTPYVPYYFDSNAKIETDTFNVNYNIHFVNNDYSKIDSVIVNYLKHSSVDGESYTQKILQQSFLPYNCSVYVYGESTDVYGNVKQTLVFKNLISSDFGTNISYSLANTTKFTPFEDCPFDQQIIDALPLSITQYLQPTALIQSDDAEIIALAKELTKNCVTVADKVEAIIAWNKENITYDYTLSPEGIDAKSVLQSRNTICEGYSNFTCAMLRSVGVPTRYVAGLMINSTPVTYTYNGVNGYFEHGEGGHAWVEVFYPSLNKWVPSEPQMNANFITADYITDFRSQFYFTIQYKSSQSLVPGTVNYTFSGHSSKKMYLSNMQLTNHEPYEKGVKHEKLLFLQVTPKQGCNASSNFPDLAEGISGSYNICNTISQEIYTVPSIQKATSYIWTLPSGTEQETVSNSITLQLNQMPSSGVLRVQGKNSYGLGIAASLPIWIQKVPDAFQISGPSTVCIGQQAKFEINNTGATPKWTLFPGLQGSYTKTTLTLQILSTATSGIIQVYGEHECGNSPVSEFPITVTTTTPKPTLLYDSVFLCYNESVVPQCSVINPYGNVKWENSDNIVSQGVQYTPQKPSLGSVDSYFVYQTVDGCITSDTSYFVVAVGDEMLSPSLVLETDVLELSSVYQTVEWYKNAQIIEDEQNMLYYPIVQGEYFARVYDNNLCSAISNVVTYVPTIIVSTNGIEKSRVRVFYAHEEVVVLLPKVQQGVVSIFNVLGTLMHEQRVSSSVEKIDMRAFPNGVYFILTNLDGEIHSAHIVK